MKLKHTSCWISFMVLICMVTLVACSGSDGKNGADGAAGTPGTSCTVKDNGDGSRTISCEDGTTATVSDGKDGQDGASCTLKDNGDGTKTISCDDGTTATVTDGQDGTNGKSCTVTSNGNGTKTISCEDGTTATVSDGQNGQDGKSCTVTDNGNGSKTISCDDGTTVTVSDGAPGAASFSLMAEVPKMLSVVVRQASIGTVSTVDFAITDGAGRGATGAKVVSTGGNLRFGLAKLIPAPAEYLSDTWQSYINRASSGVTQATTDRAGTLVDHQNGTYTYTFSMDLTNAKDPVSGESIAYDPALTHRLTVQLSGTVNGLALPYYNGIYDFIPAGGDVRVREIAAIESCNECHGKLSAHGSRIEMKYCVICHNPGTIDPTSKASVDMAVMTHGIHAASKRLADGAPAYTIGNADFSEVTYPQDLSNCLKCHNGADKNTPQGDGWKLHPNKEACGACHAAVDFSKHMGGQQDNSKCATCHSDTQIEESHLTINATPNNPQVPEGAYNFVYEIKTVTVNESRQAVVEFRIMKDGTFLDFTNLPTDLSGSPSFLVAYAAPQGDVSKPADWNQLGKTAAQPATVSIANLINASQGSLTGPDTDGYFIATLTVPAATFPATATMRAVALQGYYTQKNVNNSGTDLARHTISVIKGVTGDPARREVVDSAKCANCHEWFEGHGGNRVYTVAVCVTCHNPNLSTSGRGSDPALIGALYAGPVGATLPSPYTGTVSAEAYASVQSLVAALGMDPLTYPEATNNFKEMIHAIHASAARVEPYKFVRNRNTSGIYYYDMSEVTFPGQLGNCQTCHMPGTYDITLPDGVLATNDRTTSGNDVSWTVVNELRKTVPNATDLVSTPVSSTCYGCHNDPTAVIHYVQNGGVISQPRSTIGADSMETCVLCHGTGRMADVGMVHAE